VEEPAFLKAGVEIQKQMGFSLGAGRDTPIVELL